LVACRHKDIERDKWRLQWETPKVLLPSNSIKQILVNVRLCLLIYAMMVAMIRGF
jgi:hypothetical protein